MQRSQRSPRRGATLAGTSPANPPSRPASRTLAALAFGAALGVYLVGVAAFGTFTTPAQAYFPDLADAFLHGRLDLAAPPSTHDLTPFQGRWYVPFPPLPALLMTPLVALFGSTAVSTVAFCAVFGAATVALVPVVLDGMVRRGWVDLDRSTVLWLTALFGVGSVAWSMAVTGTVWFVGQVCAVTFAAAAVAAAVRLPLRAAAVVSGAALGVAALGRPDLVLTWPLLMGIGVARAGRRGSVRWALTSLVPVGLAGALLAAYNAARFGDPLEFGYLSAAVAPELAAQLATYGQFDVYYLAQNLRVLLLAGPTWSGPTWSGTVTGVRPDPRGLSLLLTTPAFLYLWRARGPLVRGAWIALVAELVPLLLYYNTGWEQFGYRFSLEFMLPAVVLMAHAVPPAGSRPFRVLVAVGVVVNALGTVWWIRHGLATS